MEKQINKKMYWLILLFTNVIFLIGTILIIVFSILKGELNIIIYAWSGIGFIALGYVDGFLIYKLLNSNKNNIDFLKGKNIKSNYL